MTFAVEASTAYATQIQAIGDTITYVDADESISVSLFALIGPSRTEVHILQGTAKLDGFEKDFIVVAADLVDGDTLVEPRRGAKITHETGGTVYTYSIQPYRDERHWRWSGPGNAVRRIHAKLVGTETA